MQNRYVGDMGDFAKHGLLRFLSGVTDTETSADRLRLGLIWYMHHDEVHTATDKTKVNYDGKHTSYLAYTPENLRKFASCDHVLWDKLGHLVGQDARCVHCVEASGILPCDTLFYSAMLHFVPKLPRAQKERIREHWLGCSLQATKGANLVCVDPDNGLSGDNQMYTEKGPKFVYMSDLRALWERGQSLVVYQHIGRTGGTAEEQTRAKANTLRDGIGPDATITPLRFRGGSPRVFYVISQPEHGDTIKARVGRFLNTPWSRLFDWVP